MTASLCSAAGQVGGLGGVDRERDRPIVGVAGFGRAAHESQQLRARGVEGVMLVKCAREALDHGERHVGRVQFGDGDRPVQRDDRVRIDALELTVEVRDPRPVGVARMRRRRMRGV